MSHEPLPPLRCESRPPKSPDGWLKWALALVVIGASTLDALWIIPAQRDLRAWHCANLAPAPPPRATRVDNVLLLR